LFVTPASERTIKTLGHAWIVGASASVFLGWLFIPAALPVDYFAPVVVAGPLVGLVAGGILVRTLRSTLKTATLSPRKPAAPLVTPPDCPFH
jgi:hypothetical protein